MGAMVHGPTVLLNDCQAARDIIVKLGGTQRTKYYERATLFIKRLHMLLIVDVVLIGTDDMVADALTKPLI